MLAVDVNGAARSFPGTGKADADIRGLRFAGAIYDAAHHRQLQFLDAFVIALPLRHFVANIPLDAFSELLERRARGAAAAGAGGHAGRECTQSEGLKEFASGVDFLATVTSRTGS